MDVIESRKGFLVIYEHNNPRAAMSTPATAIVSSYTTANVIGSPCSNISFHFLWVDAFLISFIAILRVIDSITNDIPKIIKVH